MLNFQEFCSENELFTILPTATRGTPVISTIHLHQIASVAVTFMVTTTMYLT